MSAFTKRDYDGLTPAGQQIIEQVITYLAGTIGRPLSQWGDDDFDDVLDLVGECEGCVPEAYCENLEKNIRLKFGCIYFTAMQRVEAQLKEMGKGKKQSCELTLLVDVCVDDRSKLAIICQDQQRVLYYDTLKAWNFEFTTLSHIVEYVQNTELAILGNGEIFLK